MKTKWEKKEDLLRANGTSEEAIFVAKEAFRKKVLNKYTFRLAGLTFISSCIVILFFISIIYLLMKNNLEAIYNSNFQLTPLQNIIGLCVVTVCVYALTSVLNNFVIKKFLIK